MRHLARRGAERQRRADRREGEARLLLRWGVQNGFAVLPKSLDPDRMRQNLDLFSFAIDDADMARMATLDRGEGVAWATGDPSR